MLKIWLHKQQRRRYIKKYVYLFLHYKQIGEQLASQLSVEEQETVESELAELKRELEPAKTTAEEALDFPSVPSTVPESLPAKEQEYAGILEPA